MRLFGLLSLGVFMSLAAFAANTVHDFKMKSIDGKESSLAAHRGKVMLIVNVASKCGYTRQYSGLEALYQKYKGQGLVIVGVPANNFGGQEPGSDTEIQQFCSRTYGVSFPMLSKVSVKGDDQTPLYAFLTDKNKHPETGGDVRWNFTKFLVDGNGKVIGRFESKVEPDSVELVQAVEKALASAK
jgi:glutathione peroxidase